MKREMNGVEKADKEIDYRYAYIGAIHRGGKLKSFTQIFTIIPKSVVAADCHKHYERFSLKVASLVDLTVGEIDFIARRAEITTIQLLELVITELEERRAMTALAQSEAGNP
jgi:hypothetical protein